MVRLLRKTEELEESDLTNINTQLVNHIHYINPNKIITNINKNVRTKEDLKNLKKKISFNHLLLREIVNNKQLQIYEFKNKQENESINNLLDINDKYETSAYRYGRHKRKTKWKETAEIRAEIGRVKEREEKKGINLSMNIDLDTELKETDVISYGIIEKKECFKFFDLSNHYTNFILENILKHVCDYIYNSEKINKLNKKENKSYETISILCISNIFVNFFQIKYGYKFLLHFLNGISVYKIKKSINTSNMDVELLNELFCNSEESFFEKVYDISYIMNYLDKHEQEIEQLSTEVSENVENDNSSTDINKYMKRLQGINKNIVYIIDVKENVLVAYNFNKSFLYNSLYILINKYNIYKMDFSNYCLLLLLYSISNKFVIPFFNAFPLLFLKNKIYINVNNCIAMLNASIFFLKNESYFPCFYACNIHSYEENSWGNNMNNNRSNDKDNSKNNDNANDRNNDKKTSSITNNNNEDNNMSNYKHEQTKEHNVILLKEQIYITTEQIINYLFINRDAINVNQLLQLMEILSYIKYNKKLFTFIFNQINEMMCLLNKYQLLYFLHSLRNYQIVTKGTKKNILIEIKKNMGQYTKEEIKHIEQYL